WKRPATPTPNDEQLQALRVCYRQVAELFPRQLEAVVLGPDGAQIQLSETPDLPDSPPVFVRLCAPGSSSRSPLVESDSSASSPRCTMAVSFSGGKIRLAGREFEILANGRGEIFLLAKEGGWVPGQKPVGAEKWRLETGW